MIKFINFKRRCNELIFTIDSEDKLIRKDLNLYINILKVINGINPIKVKVKRADGNYFYEFYTIKELLIPAKKIVYDTLINSNPNIFKDSLICIDLDDISDNI